MDTGRSHATVQTRWALNLNKQVVLSLLKIALKGRVLFTESRTFIQLLSLASLHHQVYTSIYNDTTFQFSRNNSSKLEIDVNQNLLSPQDLCHFLD